MVTGKSCKKGKRRTKSPCNVCFLNPNVCLCSEIPHLSLSTKVSLAIHHYELRRTSNTGQLALAALSNSERIVRGRLGEPASFASHLDPKYTPLLLFPNEESTLLTRELLASLSKPIQLIVPDGTWRQARKVASRHPELANVLKVKVPQPPHDVHRLRNKNRAEGMATLQAIAYALGIIEGSEVQHQLLTLFETKTERTLWARGVLSDHQCKTFTPPKRT